MQQDELIIANGYVESVFSRENKELVRLSFLRQWLQTSQAIVMHLANGMLQVNHIPNMIFTGNMPLVRCITMACEVCNHCRRNGSRTSSSFSLGRTDSTEPPALINLSVIAGRRVISGSLGVVIRLGIRRVVTGIKIVRRGNRGVIILSRIFRRLGVVSRLRVRRVVCWCCSFMVAHGWVVNRSFSVVGRIDVIRRSRGGVVSRGNVIPRLFSGVVRSHCGGVTRGGVVLGGLRVVARSVVCRGVVLWRFCVVNCLSIGVVIWNGGLVVAQGWIVLRCLGVVSRLCVVSWGSCGVVSWRNVILKSFSGVAWSRVIFRGLSVILCSLGGVVEGSCVVLSNSCCVVGGSGVVFWSLGGVVGSRCVVLGSLGGVVGGCSGVVLRSLGGLVGGRCIILRSFCGVVHLSLGGVLCLLGGVNRRRANRSSLGRSGHHWCNRQQQHDAVVS